MRKGLKLRMPLRKTNLYLILALIGLIVGLFIYNYFKLREGLLDENAIRNYLKALKNNNYPDTINNILVKDIADIRIKLYTELAKDCAFVEKLEILNTKLIDANDLIDTYTKNVNDTTYKKCLDSQTDLDNLFKRYMYLYYDRKKNNTVYKEKKNKIKLSEKTLINYPYTASMVGWIWTIQDFLMLKTNMTMDATFYLTILRNYDNAYSDALNYIRAYTINKKIAENVNASNFIGPQGLTGDQGPAGGTSYTPTIPDNYVYFGFNTPSESNGNYQKLTDCSANEGGVFIPNVSNTCYRKMDGSAWRIWNVGCAWEVGNKTDNKWTRVARTSNIECDPIQNYPWSTTSNLDKNYNYFDDLGNMITNAKSLFQYAKAITSPSLL